MTTNLIIILDKSGSMSGVADATISSLNEYLDTLRHDGHKYNLSLTLFNAVVDKRIVSRPLAEVKPLTKEDYLPGGMTALYDAVCGTLKGLKTDPNKKNLVVIMTDGWENSSQEYTKANMKTIIEELQGKGTWTFVFMGANQDSYAEAAQYGIARGNTLNYSASAAGVSATMRSAALGTTGFSAQSAMSSTAFYSAEQRKKVEDTK